MAATRATGCRAARARDYINGGAGNDTVSYADAAYGITAEMYFDGDDARPTEGKITAGEWGVDTLVSIEKVEGSQFGDYLIGDERANTFWGLGGDDIIVGDARGRPAGLSRHHVRRRRQRQHPHRRQRQRLRRAGLRHRELRRRSDLHQLQQQHVLCRRPSRSGLPNSRPTWAPAAATLVIGAAYGETISLGGGNDYLYGHGGDDFLYTGAGIDVMSGGTGYDTMVFHKAMVADWQTGVLDADIASDSWVQLGSDPGIERRRCHPHQQLGLHGRAARRRRQ